MAYQNRKKSYSNSFFNWSEFLENVLYPQMFERIGEIFKDWNFTRYRRGWRSPLKLNKSTPKTARNDKTTISLKCPSLASEFGEKPVNLVGLWLIHKGKDPKAKGEEFINAVRELCEMTGVDMPEVGDAQSMEEYRKAEERKIGLAALADQMQKNLLDPNLPEARKTLEYLTEVRGYDIESDVKPMGLGYCDLQAIAKMKELGVEFTKSVAGNYPGTSKHNAYPGVDYTLAYPLYSKGKIVGFKLRLVDTNWEKVSKTLNPIGYSKLENPFGFPSLAFNANSKVEDATIYVVEGELDAMRMMVHGYENVVASGGDKLNGDIILNLKEKKLAKRFVFIYDYDVPGHGEGKGDEYRRESADFCIKNDIDAMIVEFPRGAKKYDVDDYIKDGHTWDQFAGLIRNEKLAERYLFDLEVERLRIQEESLGPDDARFLDLKDAALRLAAKCKSKTTQGNVMGIFYESTGTPLDTSNIEKIRNEILLEEEEKERKEATRQLSEKVQECVNRGDTDGALELMGKAKSVTSKSKQALYASMLEPIDVSAFYQRMAVRSPGLGTQYFFSRTDDMKSPEQLILPQGALTFVVGKSGHGKSTFMQNLALHQAMSRYVEDEGGDGLKETEEDGSSGKVVYFTYEESVDNILLKFLSIYCQRAYSKSNFRTFQSYYKNYSSNQYENKRKKARGFHGIDKEKEDSVNDFVEKEKAFMNRIIATGRLVIKEPCMSSDDLIQCIETMSRIEKIKIVFVDYAQLLHKDNSAATPRHEELKTICEGLMDLSKKTGLPIVLGSQFNRDVSGPADMEKEKMSESSNLEKCANTIVSIYNLAEKFKADDKNNKANKEFQAAHKKFLEDKERTYIYAEIQKSREMPINYYTFLRFIGASGLMAGNNPQKPNDENDFGTAPVPEREPQSNRTIWGKPVDDDDDNPF